MEELSQAKAAWPMIAVCWGERSDSELVLAVKRDLETEEI
jgi:hypothetical protein